MTQTDRITLVDISHFEGSPCKECIVGSTCTRSWESGSGCKKLADFIIAQLTLDGENND